MLVLKIRVQYNSLQHRLTNLTQTWAPEHQVKLTGVVWCHVRVKSKYGVTKTCVCDAGIILKSFCFNGELSSCDSLCQYINQGKVICFLDAGLSSSSPLSSWRSCRFNRSRVSNIGVRPEFWQHDVTCCHRTHSWGWLLFISTASDFIVLLPWTGLRWLTVPARFKKIWVVNLTVTSQLQNHLCKWSINVQKQTLKCSFDQSFQKSGFLFSFGLAPCRLSHWKLVACAAGCN